MGSREIVIPARPKREGNFGFGTIGRSHQIYANWFMMSVKSPDLYHYDVSITKDLPPLGQDNASETGRSSFRSGPSRRGRPDRPLTPETTRVALAQLANELGWREGSWAYDGRSNMYAINNMLGMEKRIDVTMEGDRRSTPYKITIKLVNELRNVGDALREFQRNNHGPTTLPPQEYIQALDIILRHPKAMIASTDPNVMTLGPAILFNDRSKIDLGANVYAWRGYRQSIRLCQNGIALNIDSSVTPMWRSPALEEDERPLNMIMADLANNCPRHELGRFLYNKLKNLKIKATHNGFKKTIRGFTDNPPHREMFEIEEEDGRKRTTNVAEYFRDRYHIELRDTQMPCVDLSGRNSTKKSVLPPELCFLLPKQRCSNINPEQQARLVSQAPMPPSQLRNFLDHNIKSVAKDCDAKLKETFGLSINDRMTQVEARALPEVTLQYNTLKDGLGKGAWNLRGVQFYRSTTIESYGILSFADNKFDVKKFVHREFVPAFGDYGIRTPRELPPVIRGSLRDVDRSFEDVKGAAARTYRRTPQLILVILPNKGAQLYKAVKQAGDSLFGVISQCVVVTNLQRSNLCMYLGNVMMKINAKLSGINVRISPDSINRFPKFLQNFEDDPYIVMGFDVNHPQQGISGPSIAAIVGSMDKHLGVFASRLMMQVHRKGRGVQEIILGVYGMVIDVLTEFCRRNGKYPEHFIIYRDGVSEGQFSQVVEHEYLEVRRACEEIHPEYRPKITFTVVQKKHQTRFFPTSNKYADDKGNVKPGTVVDSGITSPSECDFFLSSHAGLLGTNRPAHYHVLVDENGFTADELQLFTYWTTFTFARCTRSISVPPAARYADLAAARGRLLLAGEGDGRGRGRGREGEGEQGEGPELVPLHPDVETTMFFL